MIVVHTKRRGAFEWTTVKHLYADFGRLPTVGEYLAIKDLDIQTTFKVQFVVHALGRIAVSAEIYAIEVDVFEEMRKAMPNAFPAGGQEVARGAE